MLAVLCCQVVVPPVLVGQVLALTAAAIATRAFLLNAFAAEVIANVTHASPSYA